MAYRIYCSVYDCLNSSTSTPALSFFKLPTQSDRLSEWLRLMGRNDLPNKPKNTCHRVCESHFNEQDILATSKRKILRKNALPSLNLPDLQRTVSEDSQKEDKQTEVVLLVENCSQTQEANKRNNQTIISLYCDTPTKIKLESERKLKHNETEDKSQKTQESNCSNVRTAQQVIDDRNMTRKVKCRLYCSAYGCLNSTLSNPELTFFKLPPQKERLSKWLQLIRRADLADKIKSSSYRVCETHFNQKDILPKSNRRILKKNTLPSLNLPDVQWTGPEEFQKECKPVVSRVDNCTQTANEYTHTTKTLSCDSPRKLDATEETQESTFHKLCDTFLNEELALLVKTQTRLKLHGKGKQYDENYILFCLNMYFNSPQTYRLLQNALSLPCTKTLIKHSSPITTEINERTMSILKIKVAQMTEAEKNCSVMIKSIPLKANLFYNIGEDKIIGFHEVDGWQSPEPAKNALVIMVRGIFVNWKQPIAYALLSECRSYDEITKWVDKVLEKLFDIGLNIRTFVSDLDSDLLKEATKRSVTVEKPYFLVNDRKIYYFFDALHLIKLVRNSLMHYDFHFGESVAKYDHIVQFYDQDIKKSCRLAHKLSNSHIKPTNTEKMKVCYATQLLSKSVATGISTYIDFNVIEESGRDTAAIITKMNDLFDSLNSSNLKHNYEYKRAYRGNYTQRTFLSEMLSFFQGLKLINPKNGRDCTSNVKFIQGFQITITSLLLLFEDLKLEGHTFLYTRRLNIDALDIFFRQIRTLNCIATNPTCRQFQSAFEKIYFSNILKPPKGENCEDDLRKFLVRTTREVVDNPIPAKVDEISNMNEEELDSSVRIMRSEYNQLDIPENKSLFYICGYLLKRCGEKHNDCQSLKSYMKPYRRNRNFIEENSYLRYRNYSKNNLQNLLIVPCDDFVEYVEKMEDTFRASFKRKRINCKLSATIYKQIKEIDFCPPCCCFPKIYLRKLFIRMRIFYTLMFNNRAYRTSRQRRKYFSIPIF